MPIKNIITLVLLSVLILVGWTFFQNWMWPPKPRPPRTPEEQVAVWPWRGLPDQKQEEIFARLLSASSPGWSGLDAATRLATEIKRDDPAVRAWLARRDEKPRPKPVAVKHEIVDLGNDSFNLKVRLTSRGAGVEHVVLTKFEEADEDGRKPKLVDGKAVELPLVPGVREPSSLLYHYAKPSEDKDNRPQADLGELDWVLKSKKTGEGEDVQEVVFTCDVPGQDVRLTKTYTLAKNAYHLGLAVTMERIGAGPEAVPFQYQLTGAHGLPIEGKWYTTVYHNAIIGRGDQRNFERFLQDSRSVSYQEGGASVDALNTTLRYAAVATQYFASAVVVDDEQDKGVNQDFLAWARPTLEQPPSEHQSFLDDITVRLISKKIELQPGKPVTHKYLLYNGPVKVSQLDFYQADAAGKALVDRYANTLHLRTMTDYGGYKWWSDLLVTCTNVMHWLLNGILKVLGAIHLPWRYGFAIILLTVVVRGAMFPLSRRQTQAAVQMQEKMAKLKKDLAPELRKIEEKHRDDPMAKRRAEHELYMKHGVNPMAMMNSCWLMFAQLPIFLGLYYALQESIHFRLKPFLWMQNLAAPDMLFAWPWKGVIPWLTDPLNIGSMLYLGPYLNVLPLVWVVLMFVQQKVLTPPAADEQQEMQQRMMKFMLLMFFFFFYKVPAGLCIYWIGSMLWTLGERKLLLKPKPAPAGGPAVPGRRPAAGGAPTSPNRRRPTPNGQANGDGVLHKVREWVAKVLEQAKKK